MDAHRPRLGQVAVVLSAFALLLALSIFWPLMTDNLAFKRTHATAWTMTLLATPAFYIFARTYGRAPLDNWWRLTWTAGWGLALVHFWYGLFHLHAGDAVSVFERQGWVLAGTIFGFLAIWGWDVFNAWARADWREEAILSRRPAFWVGLIAFIVSTVLFNNDAQSLTVGLILTGAVLLAAAQRVDALGSWRAFFDSPLPPTILGVGMVGAALLGPGFLSTGSAASIVAAEAKWTVWPALILGGIAAGLFVAKAPDGLKSWGWDGWQIAGAGAYLVHVYAGFGRYFDWSFDAMLAAQGMLVAGANWALAILWPLSALAAWTGRRATPLHAISTVFFMIAAVLSVYDRPGGVFWLGALLVAIWVIAGALRIIRR